MAQRKIYVHIGSYGSGKTELSLNEVRRMNALGMQPTLVDLDIVNPYFRSGEHAQTLKEEGIATIMPVYANTAVDVPSLPPDIQRIFDENLSGVFDVGGDPVGATALGRYARFLKQADAWIRCVVNTARPFTSTPDEIVEMATLLMQQSRLPINALVHNTHLAQETTPEMVQEGYGIVREAAERLGVPVEFTCVAGELDVPDVGEIRRITLYTHPEWLYE